MSSCKQVQEHKLVVDPAAHGASELLGAAFGDVGVHARSAVGVSVLPLDAPVEVEVIVEFS